MARKLIVEIVGDSKSLERSLNSSTAAVDKFGKQTTSVGAKADGAFKKIQGGLAGAFVGGVAAGAAVQGIKTVVGAASDLNEQITKNQQVFGSSAAAVEAWSKTTAKSIGISETAALEATGTFGNLFAAIGVAGPAAADTSKRLVQLAADLASFNNASPEDTLNAIRSGLVGEAEPLRRYGVLLSEVRVQQVAMAQTGKTTAASLTVQEKAAARVAIIFKDTANAQGDFARTSGGLANKQRILSASVSDLEANLGKALLPAIQKTTGGLADLVIEVNASITALRKLSKVKVPTIVIPFTSKKVGGEGGGGLDLGDIGKGIAGFGLKGLGFIPQTAPIARAIELQLQITAAKAADAAKEEASRQVTILGDKFADSLNTMLSGALTLAQTKIVPPTPTKNAGGKSGFGFGLTPEDLFGPLIKDITPALNESLLDAQISGNQKRIRAVLVKTRDSLTAALDDPRLKRPGRIKIKTALESIVGQIASIDSAAQSAADAAASKAASAASKAAAKAKAAATAAKQRQRDRFDLILQNLTTKEDAAEITTRFIDDINIENKIQAAILRQIKVEGRTAELVGKLADSRAKEAKAVKGRRLAKDFKLLGLGPTGEEAIPGKDSLKVQFDRITRQVGTGTIVLGGKLTKQLAGVAKLLARSAKSIAPEVSSAIQTIFDAINDTVNKNKDQVFTISPQTQALNKNKIVAGLGLDRDTERLIKSRLQGFNAAGRRLNPAPGTTGAFGVTLPPINLTTTINMDGQKVAQGTSIWQGKNHRSNPRQKRGPWSGGGWS